jgi:hypothetical protein
MRKLRNVVPLTTTGWVAVLSAVPLLLSAVKGGFETCKDLNEGWRSPAVEQVCGARESELERKNRTLMAAHFMMQPVRTDEVISTADDYLEVSVFSTGAAVVVRRTTIDGQPHQQMSWFTRDDVAPTESSGVRMSGLAWAGDPVKTKAYVANTKRIRVPIKMMSPGVAKVQYVYLVATGTCHEVVLESVTTGKILEILETRCDVVAPK